MCPGLKAGLSNMPESTHQQHQEERQELGQLLLQERHEHSHCSQDLHHADPAAATKEVCRQVCHLSAQQHVVAQAASQSSEWRGHSKRLTAFCEHTTIIQDNRLRRLTAELHCCDTTPVCTAQASQAWCIWAISLRTRQDSGSHLLPGDLQRLCL